MRLQTAPRELLVARRRRVSISPALRAATGTGIAAVTCVLLLLSPAFTIRTVRWSGVVEPLHSRLEEIEKSLAGRPLMLLSQSELEDLLHVDSGTLQLRFERHLPETLEIIVKPRFAVWAHGRGPIFDAHGSRLDQSHAVPGLKRLEGFALDDERSELAPADVRLLGQLLEMERQTGLELSGVARRGADLVLTLSPSRQQVWLRAEDLDAGLHKLRLLGRRLDAENLPGRVDLRFRDQILLAARGREERRDR